MLVKKKSVVWNVANHKNAYIAYNILILRMYKQNIEKLQYTTRKKVKNFNMQKNWKKLFRQQQFHKKKLKKIIVTLLLLFALN